jgi:hypothetical protein
MKIRIGILPKQKEKREKAAWFSLVPFPLSLFLLGKARAVLSLSGKGF